MEESLRLTIFTMLLWLCTLTPCLAQGTITSNQTISHDQTIVSANGLFEMGFFRPSSGSNRWYLGIWYKKVSTGTVVWVANRETPLRAHNTSSSHGGVLKFDTRGSLVLLSATSSRSIWSSLGPSTSVVLNNPVGRLLDTGNLVIEDGGNVIWESFDHPGDTLLPGMKIGKDLVTGLEMYLTAWKSYDDPSPSNLTLKLDLNGYPPQLFVSNGLVPYWRMFHTANSTSFTSPSYYEEFVFNGNAIYYKYELNADSVVARMILPPDGHLKLLNWAFVDRSQGWNTLWYSLAEICDTYAICGTHIMCKLGVCQCLEGFVIDKGGCRRKVPLECGDGHDPSNSRIKFEPIKVKKLPDTRQSLFNESMTNRECEMACRSNCSCTAYGEIVDKESGCWLWFGELTDITLDQGPPIYLLYVKLSTLSDLRQKGIIRVALLTLSGTVLVGLILMAFAYRIMRKRSYLKRKGKPIFPVSYTSLSRKEDIELPEFSVSEITKATRNFSIENKLGEGGFGPVYKGLLDDGQEIAVKRLSKTSKQGLIEFKNEVTCIARLHHRNLVKLVGYCVQGDEMMLVYEYMPNKSLDSHIHGTRSSSLDWPQRFHIINGIARGLQYLHQDSRLRIIHRDLKVGNVLLDSDMNPKISDFGLARILEGHESIANDTKVVGTHGYISPECFDHGYFSVKSDVFSFGVLVLEIVSGKKNRGFSHRDYQYHSLAGYAWKLYKAGKSLELVDASLQGSFAVHEVLRTIHVALLCVQHRAEDRPTMLSVVLMLGSEGALPPPKEPGFLVNSSSFSNTLQAPVSLDQAIITLLDAR